MRQSQHHESKAIPALMVAAASGWVLMNDHAGPMLNGADINPLWAGAAFFFGISTCTLLAETFRAVSGALDMARVKIPQGRHGTAGWIKHRWQIWRDIKWFGWGPYFGTLNGKAIISKIQSVCLTIGPPGTGKTVGFVMMLILCLRCSKTIPDFKGELSAVLARPLRERGEKVYIMNVGDVLSDVLGPTEKYNPMSAVIADCFWREGGLRDVSDDSAELALDLLEEKDTANGDNIYFRHGSRDLDEFVMQIVVLVHGDGANLGHVAQMLNDKSALLQHALWAAGRLETVDAAGNKTFEEFPIEDSPWIDRHSIEDVLDYKEHLKGISSKAADLILSPDSTAINSFLTGAQQSLKRFGRATRAHQATSASTFRFSEQKEAPTTVFIVADPSRKNAQKDVLGLIQSCMLIELKRHPNKHVPVALIADEASNFKISDLGSLLTWARSFSILIFIIIQSFSAFRQTYSRETLETLLNVAEVKQFLPSGQTEPETLDLIEKMLGEESVIMETHQSSGGFGGVQGTSYMETGRPLMTRDQIRRCKKTILFLKRNKPMLIDLPTIAAVSPFRKQIDINPYHGKPFLRRIKLRLEGRDGPFLWRVIAPRAKRLWGKVFSKKSSADNL